MDLQALSFIELKDLLAQVEAEIGQREKAEKAEAKNKILELAKAHGLSLDELFKQAESKVKKSVEAKYRHPTDASLTWSGRGRKPLWVQALLDQGKTLEELAI
ncbi:KorB protein [Chromobacterium violaceum]|uniref:H-NS histone family protein n=1 Tax=Chromobacterium violaceum TaxID=536 RepID=UPI0009DA1A0E|nr:H-NS histone family protein [Chromobacterium violaceum]OQS11655.1 KorB protein [Chromobacterium violaceum]OQS29210.1 KorB protein [Chromobacterium violaceum]